MHWLYKLSKVYKSIEMEEGFTKEKYHFEYICHFCVLILKKISEWKGKRKTGFN